MTVREYDLAELDDLGPITATEVVRCDSLTVVYFELADGSPGVCEVWPDHRPAMNVNCRYSLAPRPRERRGPVFKAVLLQKHVTH